MELEAYSQAIPLRKGARSRRAVPESQFRLGPVDVLEFPAVGCGEARHDLARPVDDLGLYLAVEAFGVYEKMRTGERERPRHDFAVAVRHHAAETVPPERRRANRAVVVHALLVHRRLADLLTAHLRVAAQGRVVEPQPLVLDDADAAHRRKIAGVPLARTPAARPDRLLRRARVMPAIARESEL